MARGAAPGCNLDYAAMGFDTNFRPAAIVAVQRAECRRPSNGFVRSDRERSRDVTDAGRAPNQRLPAVGGRRGSKEGNEMMIAKRILLGVCAVLLSCTVGSVVPAMAQSDSMKKESMSKDSMSKDSMKKESMKKESMKKDGMAKDDMKKDKMSGDSMKKDNMSKDPMK
jgi:pentapeptide MXKDX repeat protein